MGTLLLTMCMGIIYGIAIAMNKIYYMYNDSLLSKAWTCFAIIWVSTLCWTAVGATINYIKYEINNK